MPAFDLQDADQKIRRFDVVGERLAGRKFVKHVGLHDDDEQQVSDSTILAVHMAPPLRRGDAFTAHVTGSVPLTNSEIQQIETWIQEICDEYETHGISRTSHAQYVACPGWIDVPSTGVRRYRRFSCAGFVLCGYEEVGIQLLLLSKNVLPQSDITLLKTAFGDAIDRIREKMGLVGNGPWPVVLPGYILHALNRERQDIESKPYVAKVGDEDF